MPALPGVAIGPIQNLFMKTASEIINTIAECAEVLDSAKANQPPRYIKVRLSTLEAMGFTPEEINQIVNSNDGVQKAIDIHRGKGVSIC